MKGTFFAVVLVAFMLVLVLQAQIKSDERQKQERIQTLHDIFSYVEESGVEFRDSLSGELLGKEYHGIFDHSMNLHTLKIFNGDTSFVNVKVEMQDDKVVHEYNLSKEGVSFPKPQPSYRERDQVRIGFQQVLETIRGE